VKTHLEAKATFPSNAAHNGKLVNFPANLHAFFSCVAQCEGWKEDDFRLGSASTGKPNGSEMSSGFVSPPSLGLKGTL